MAKDELKFYTTLKKIGYMFCLLEKDSIQNNDSNALESYQIQKQVFLESLNSSETDIFLNTLSFPYDLSLYKYLEHKKLSSDVLTQACEDFDISYELLSKKLKEYVKYSYANLVSSGIDSDFSGIAVKVSEMREQNLNLETNTNKNI